MWCLWYERNAQTFEGQEKSVLGLKLILLGSLFEWMNASSLFSFDHMLRYMTIVLLVLSLFGICVHGLHF